MKKIISVLLALGIFFTMMFLPVTTANAVAYNANAAVNYANQHWNDGVGKCATFVSNCLSAGNCNAWSSLVVDLRKQLINGGYGQEYLLTESGQSIYLNQNSGKIAAGDPIFFYCKKCASFPHVVICTGFNAQGKATASGHNAAWNNVTYIAGFYDASGHKDDDILVYSFHMNTSHEHSYTEYVYNWAAHPHYKCYECSCGDVKENRSEPTFVSSCDTCKNSISDDNIKSGNYFIKNKGSGGYLNVAYGKDVDGTAIHNHEFGNYDSQVYNIYRAKDGYEMMPLCSKTRVVNPYCWTVESGKEVNLYSKTNESSQWWKFQPVGDGFIIRNAQNPQMCLTPYNYAMIVSEYTGKDNQIWYLEKAYTIKYNANGGGNAPSSQRVRAGYRATISSQMPYRKCHTFLGWSTDRNAKTANIAPGSSTTLSKDKTLYAVWQDDHIYKTSVTRATIGKNGKIVTKCNACGDVLNTKTISAVKTIKLSSTSYTYNGKVKTPTITVKDAAGKTISSKNYTVKYASGRKNVGTYKVTIKMKGNYSGSKTLTFKIVPKTASVNKLSAKVKSFVVKLNRVAKQGSGYEIQYSTSKKFTKSTTKTKTVKSYKTSSVTFKKLKEKKTYYVRVRTYKTVGKTKYYSDWSKYKKVKTK